VTPEKRRAVVR